MNSVFNINNLKNGLEKNYHDNGLLSNEINYVNGKRNGFCKYYNNKGKLYLTGVYKEAVIIWNYFSDGNIVLVEIMRKGRLIFRNGNGFNEFHF